MQDETADTRRSFLKAATAGAGPAAIGDFANAQSFRLQAEPATSRTLREPCFGGPKNKRLCMASGHSDYALYVEAHGAA